MVRWTWEDGSCPVLKCIPIVMELSFLPRKYERMGATELSSLMHSIGVSGQRGAFKTVIAPGIRSSSRVVWPAPFASSPFLGSFVILDEHGSG
ncbi:hypothetical protein O9929_20990 [Vibrio lentus]|nr:hypothetical protein [Vibrio lentus]